MPKLLTFIVAALALTGSGAATFASGAGSALAPEPARLTSSLSGSTGVNAPAVYVNTAVKTTVIKWSSSYVAVVSPPPAGTPCATADLGTGTTTTRVIQAAGVYRRCA